MNLLRWLITEMRTTPPSPRPVRPPDPRYPSITCPVCHMTSYYIEDIRHGWCGNCCAETSPPRMDFKRE